MHTVFGEVSSGSTLAMMKLTDQRKIPQIITLSADDRITGSEKSRYAFRTSNTVAMENRMIGEFAQRQGAKKMYAIVSDYQVGRDMWAALKTDFESRNIQVVGMDLTAIGTKDYAVLLDKALRSGADSLMLLVVGGDVVTSLKQGADIGLAQKMRVMGTMLMDETLGLRPSAPPARSALIPPCATTTRRIRRAIRNSLPPIKAKFNELPSQYAGEAYDGLSWWLDTVESTGVWDKEKWVDAFRSSACARIRSKA